MNKNIELCVSGDYALFSDPCFRIGGEKCSYIVPTYEALKGIMRSVYWKPTITWYIDKVRVMKPIRMEQMGIRTLRYHEGGADLSYYTYLKDVEYQIQAHFEFAMRQIEMVQDRNKKKHYEIAQRRIRSGGACDVFLGTRECQAYVTPCTFGEGKGHYDHHPQIDLGMMYHGITYPNEAYNKETQGRMTINMWHAYMDGGIITFPRPQDCPVHKPSAQMQEKIFRDIRKKEVEE